MTIIHSPECAVNKEPTDHNGACDCGVLEEEGDDEFVECCFIDYSGGNCMEPAEWEIFFGPEFGIYDSTFSCSNHVGWLLSDADEHRIFHL
jgi:hypothetical protein